MTPSKASNSEAGEVQMTDQEEQQEQNLKHIEQQAQERQKIERQIESYLIERAGAADTLEGLVHWWLMQQRMMESERLIREAVSSLCNRGVIEKRILPDGTDMYYSKNKLKCDSGDANDG